MGTVGMAVRIGDIVSVYFMVAVVQGAGCGRDKRPIGGHSLFGRSRIEDNFVSDMALKLLHLPPMRLFRNSKALKFSEEASRDIPSLSSRRPFDALFNDKEIEQNEINDDLCPWSIPTWQEGGRKPNCFAVPRSRGQEYRSADGSCNNEARSLYGMSGTPMQRLSPSTYTFGNSSPRKNARGGDLPSGRLLSNVLFKGDEDRKQPGVTMLLMQFGQFIDHDLTHGPTLKLRKGNGKCCDPMKTDKDKFWVFPKDKFYREDDICFPIHIPNNDPTWAKKGRTCMEFTRTMPSPTLDCRRGVREQMNDITHWLDASNTYGSTKQEAQQLRDTIDPSKLLIHKNGNLLPKCSDSRERSKVETCTGCDQVSLTNDKVVPDTCYFSGDSRANEQPGLTVMHTVWLREHNRVSTKLARINPGWNKDRLFQEAKRIVTAEYQHMVYKEWLPIILGRETMQKLRIEPARSGYSNSYNPEIDPRITNEFASAAFRFGHSMIHSSIPRRGDRNETIIAIDLNAAFDKPFRNPITVDHILRGMLTEEVLAWDPNFSNGIREHLFEDELDLMALNIQRARDHGIPGYTKYRSICGNPIRSNSFEGLAKDGIIPASSARKLKEVYENVDDIDLFVGGTFESGHRHDPQSILGPTFSCIVGDQFRRLKEGDRFWYENGSEKSTSFTLEQLAEIKKSSFARILCDNTGIKHLQPRVFKMKDERKNAFVSCADRRKVPVMDLTKFS